MIKKIIIILSAILVSFLTVYTFAVVRNRHFVETVKTSDLAMSTGQSFFRKFLNNQKVVEEEATKPEVDETSNQTTNETSKEELTNEGYVLSNIPNKKILPNIRHAYQTFNNCGPASLSMSLSFYGVNVSQQTLGNELRPYQIANGDNDDKSVTLYELAEKSKNYGFTPIHRPVGSIDLLQKLVANDIPVITRTWLKVNEDIGHFRVVKGYDKTKGVLIQDDSLEGKDLEFTYATFNQLWKKFNYEYLILVEEDKMPLVKELLAENYDEKKAWENAAKLSLADLKTNPNDTYARFNLAVAYYNLGQFAKTVEEYEKVADKLPERTLWYQLEPVLAYFETGNYDKVFEISNFIIENNNRAYSELYILRGRIYLEQGKNDLAKKEFENAIKYNSNMEISEEYLNQVGL